MIEPGEILCPVVLRQPPLYSGGGYVKLGVRRALEISLVNVATFFALDGPGGPIRDALIVELNGRYVYARQYGTTSVSQGDRVEFIHPDFGG